MKWVSGWLKKASGGNILILHNKLVALAFGTTPAITKSSKFH